jgi:hypothetical protein
MSIRIQSKVTTYNGIEYRSRTEARWAVFFDGIGISFDYEKEFLQLSDGKSYLPDFYLPQFNAYLEVKPNSDSIITEECVKARQLAHDLEGQAIKVWLSTGGPSEQNGNIIPLSSWNKSDDIAHILAVKENRYMFYQDRRDEGLFWLYAEDNDETMRQTYLIGGWGIETDHTREPLMFGLVKKSYELARSFVFED